MAILALPAAARAGPPTALACIAPNTSDTLTRVQHRDVAAKAYWLSRDRLQWPGAPADGRFSAQDATGRPEWRGTFLAFTDSQSAGMWHLRALGHAGITDVQLLPVFDLSSVPEVNCETPRIPAAAPDAESQQAAVSSVRERDCYNWGYDPHHFTVPEGSYATAARAEPVSGRFTVPARTAVVFVVE